MIMPTTYVASNGLLETIMAKVLPISMYMLLTLGFFFFPAAEDGFGKTSYVPWVSDICSCKKESPRVSNIYIDFGSVLVIMVSSSPLLATYVVGMIIDAFGPD